mmetsp:Transcript_6824/g.11016  ORF Transcript_6824/g.11016 Transcript_6824/m.11016 type:complete len:208 (-) Transcript_6824:66-689(-)
MEGTDAASKESKELEDEKPCRSMPLQFLSKKRKLNKAAADSERASGLASKQASKPEALSNAGSGENEEVKTPAKKTRAKSTKASRESKKTKTPDQQTDDAPTVEATTEVPVDTPVQTPIEAPANLEKVPEDEPEQPKRGRGRPKKIGLLPVKEKKKSKKASNTEQVDDPTTEETGGESLVDKRSPKDPREEARKAPKISDDEEAIVA